MNLLFVGPLQSEAGNGSKNLLKSRKSLILTRTSETGRRAHGVIKDRFHLLRGQHDQIGSSFPKLLITLIIPPGLAQIGWQWSKIILSTGCLKLSCPPPGLGWWVLSSTGCRRSWKLSFCSFCSFDERMKTAKEDLPTPSPTGRTRYPPPPPE